MFASKVQVWSIFLPCIITLFYGLLVMAIDPVRGITSLVMASALALVCGSIGENRGKIVQQDINLQRLQERYEMLEQKELATESYDGQENEKAN